MSAAERRRIEAVYAGRSYDTDPEYSDVNPVYLQRAQNLERFILRGLRAAGKVDNLGGLDIVDFGCGNGRWMGRWLAWGATPRRLHGLDVRSSAVAMAKESFPSVDFEAVAADRIPYDDSSVDIITFNLVFSSILDTDLRATVVSEAQRVLRPGGVVLWYDFTVDNPRNRDVRGLPKREVRELWRPLTPVFEKTLTLAPPIARRLIPASWTTAQNLEALIPALRTHFFAVFSA